MEYDATLILSLLKLCSSKHKNYDPLISSQLSTLYSPETVIFFFGKLENAKPLPDQPLPSSDHHSSSSSKRKHHFTSSIFSFFGLSSASSSSTTHEGSKYTMVPMEELSIKDAPASEVIDVDKLAMIVEVLKMKRKDGEIDN